MIAQALALALATAAAAATFDGAPTVESSPQHVRLSATTVAVDREAVRRAGVSYVVIGPQRVQLDARDARRGTRGTQVQVGTHGVRAFLDVARSNRWVRTEATQQVLVLSGGSARVASQQLTLDRRTAHSSGPVLDVTPTVLADGSVHLRISARLEDVAVDRRWGYAVDGSPVAVETELIVPAGVEVIIASGSTVETTRESGLLRLASSDRERDVFVVVTATVQ
jgi:hypothetical protein